MDSGEIRVRYVISDRERAKSVTTGVENRSQKIETAVETDPEQLLETTPSAACDCIVVATGLDEYDSVELCQELKTKTGIPCILHEKEKRIENPEQILESNIDAYVRNGADEREEITLVQRIKTHVTQTETQREIELLSTEQELLADVASDIFWTYDFEDETLVVDESISQYGYDPDEVGSTIDWWFERIHPDDRDRVRSLYQSISAGKQSVFDSIGELGGRVDTEFKFQQADGSYVTILLRILCLFDATEKPRQLIGSATDVTDQRHARDRFASLVEHSSTVIAVVDKQGTYEYNSPSVQRVLGYEPEKLRGEFAFQYVHPEDRERVMAQFQKMVTSSESVVASVEFRAEHSDGSWVWLEAIGTNETAPAIDGYVINYTDITERKEYEQKLERIKQQYDAILADPETFVGLLDTDWRMQEVNDTALEFIETSRNEVLGTPFPDTPWWDDASIARATLESHLERATAGETVRFDVKLSGAAERERFVDVTLAPVTSDGSVDSLMAIGRNITELKRRERALDELHRTTREFAEAKDRKRVLELAVDAVEAFLDKPIAGAWLYDDEADLLAPVARTDLAAELLDKQPTLTGGDSLTWETFQAGEYRLYNEVQSEPGTDKDEPTVHSEIILPLDDIGVLTIGAPEEQTFDDLDFALARLLAANTEAALERAARENTLREQRTRLQQQNEQLEQVASILSHDLRNPLNVATLRTELAQRDTDTPHLDDVETALSRMEQLIEDVLRLARGGQSVSETEEASIQTLVSECWTVVTTGTATLELEDSFTVLCDPSRLRHVLENLFGNAVEHGTNADDGDSDGSVTVRIGRLDDGFYVEDDGPGIPENERDHIFEAGYTTSDDGTGFGLTIVDTIASAHGWDVRLTESKEGGARFEFRNVEIVE